MNEYRIVLFGLNYSNTESLKSNSSTLKILELFGIWWQLFGYSNTRKSQMDWIQIVLLFGPTLLLIAKKDIQRSCQPDLVKTLPLPFKTFWTGNIWNINFQFKNDWYTLKKLTKPVFAFRHLKNLDCFSIYPSCILPSL